MSLKSEQIKELLTRGIDVIIPSREAVEKELSSGKKLTVYLGVDPTGPQLHLGHSAPMLLLRRFQKLGHKTILLIGDFTARIGDPSGKKSQRKPLSAKEIAEHLKTYKKQASKILQFAPAQNPTEIKFNSKWLAGLKFGDLLDITSRFTVHQMLTRDMFQRRIKEGAHIGVNEFLYPFAQGYDSVALKTDAEIGASDQLFNMLIGRDMVRAYLKKEKFVITTRLLVNPATGAKMSKSEGGLVALDDSPKDMYGKIMAFPDELVEECFILCTEASIAQIENVMKLPPREAKASLAHEIVAMYYNKTAADKAEAEFSKVFSAHELPADILISHIQSKTKNIIDLLIDTGLAASKSEARRLVEQGGVRVDNVVAKDPKKNIEIKDDMVIQVGRRRFVKLALG